MSDVKVDPLTLSIVKKIYETYGEKGMQEFINSGCKDMPPVKLSAKELEHLKGGGVIRGFQQCGEFLMDRNSWKFLGF